MPFVSLQITETYAFLPREAVTKFLLCCAECQKRTHDERKTSPNSSSCDSIHEDRTAVSQSVDPAVAEKLFQVPLDYSATCREYDSGNDWKPEYDNNNCNQPFNYCTKRLNSILDPNDVTRKRKRKFTRKIVRPVMVESSQDAELGDLRCVKNEEVGKNDGIDALGVKVNEDRSVNIIAYGVNNGRINQ